MFRSSSSRCLRPGLVVLVTTIALSLLFANQATSQEGGLIVSPPYSDVDPSNVHRDNIASLKAAGILDGTECGPDQFCPSEPLSRRTFAVWMVRVLDGDQAPDFVDPNAVGTSRFADVEASEPESLFIERLSDLRVTAGCASKPWRYCPDTNVSRAQMASFLARAFGLGGADDAGFIDVSEDSTHYDTINMLAASGITTGCSSTPKRYCPSQATTRAQMASFLARAIEWRNARNLVEPEPEEPEPVEPINVAGTDNSVQLDVSYDESAHQARISWRPTSNNPTQVTHYIVQWRPYWDGFTDGLQQRVELSDLRNGQFLVLINPTQNIYGVRVITVGSASSHLATSEVKVPSNSNKLRDLIKERIIDPHQGDWPWLRDTWKHMSGPEFGFGVSNSLWAGARVYRGSQSADRNSLEREIAKSLSVHPSALDHFDAGNWRSTMIHELGHVYTLTNDIGDDSLSQAAGFLYFHLIYVNHGLDGVDSTSCVGHELYADMANIAFFDREFSPGRRGWSYWGRCGLSLSLQEYETIKREAPAVALSVFRDQEVPDWFYATYQKSDGSIDLDKLWADINSYLPAVGDRGVIIGHLRHEFGGYCSEEQVRKFLDGRITQLDTPWRDAGC